MVKFLHNRFFARGSATAQHPTCKTACEKIFLNLKSLLKKHLFDAVPLYSSQVIKSTVNNFLTNLFRGKTPQPIFARGSATAQHLTCKTACEKFFLNLKSLLKKHLFDAVPLYSSQVIKSTVNNFLTNLFRGKTPQPIFRSGQYLI